MNLLYLGHYALDLFHGQDERIEEHHGGLVRALTAVSGLLEKKDTLIPVCGVHGDDAPKLLEALARLPGIDPSGIFVQPEPTNRVHFYHRGNGQRVACTDRLAPPIPFSRIKGFLDADGVLVNMLSGSDITLETLDEIRMTIRGKKTALHFDYHNLVRGIQPDKERVFRPLPEWRRWAFMADTVQLNEEEIAHLTIERLSERQAVGHLLTLGVKGVLVTLGPRGVRLYVNEHKRIVGVDIGAANAMDAATTVGAGDTFGAVFFYRYLKTGDIAASAQAAHDTTGETLQHLDS
jgi:sugar/nucleoside kinase (ribokinase family)